MLLVHQAGSVKVGEVVRYTLTYTPSSDRILPSPSHLHVKIKNTSAIPLRAAYLHGPYTLHVSAYPSTFNPNTKVEDPHRYGVPEFEPLLKAGGHWSCKLTVPDDIRETGASFASGSRRRTSSESTRSPAKEVRSATWIIEIASQILFSNSAAVHFEVLVGRDERSLDLGFAAVASHGHGAPGQVQDHTRDRQREHGPSKGVYSKSVKLVVEDTEALWDKPKLPATENDPTMRALNDGRQKKDRKTSEYQADKEKTAASPSKKKKVHLVIITHGLHSNLGADMLYMKESIDATVRQAREDARKRKASYKKPSDSGEAKTPTVDGPTGDGKTSDKDETSTAPLSGGQEGMETNENDLDDEEEVVVRGFSGNSVRTERGIQYLGKRLAKFVLHFTYPDQPFLPIKKSVTRSLTNRLSGDKKKLEEGGPIHQGSSIHHEDGGSGHLAYTFTSISFIGHSLGGLVQTYAIAYIQKHAPAFFEQIKPVNFICMASPLLGLSNENPMYVKFALDFGLVGRTGQDLGLTWRAPTIAKSGWSAMVGGFTASPKEPKQEDPGAKPLLRILPTGPAHQVLRLFRNRTVYSNVVNDGIVPLRTSCLLFLDWRGLGKVDKARRDNGIIGTLAEFGWAELTGQNAYSSSIVPDASGESTNVITDGTNTPTRMGGGDTVPQPSDRATEDDDENAISKVLDPAPGQMLDPNRTSLDDDPKKRRRSSLVQPGGMFSDLVNFLRPILPEPRTPKAIRRGQTISKEEEQAIEDAREGKSRGTMDNPTMRPTKRPPATRGDSIEHPSSDVQAPPKTNIFEAASDILHPPIPSTSWIIDPSSRSRTIFHDRVYHPEDIPPPPTRRPHRLSRSFSSDATSTMSTPSRDSDGSVDVGAMKVEEKIARAYHRDLSWRKVLVSLEPDAHNNMIVRRMFANAYGWPVVKHLCDTHFADSWSAKTRDEEEPAVDRAKGTTDSIPATGEEVKGQLDRKPPTRSPSEMRENRDEVADLDKSTGDIAILDGKHRTVLERTTSADWDDSYFDGSDDEDDEEEDGYKGVVQRFLGPRVAHAPGSRKETRSTSQPAVPSDGHRGLRPTSPEAERMQLPKTPPRAVLTGKLTAEPRHIRTPSIGTVAGSSLEMGLGKSIEEQLTPPRKKGGVSESHGPGISEQVASAVSSPKH